MVSSIKGEGEQDSETLIRLALRATVK